MTTVDGRARLRRLRWAVRGTLLLGVLASVAANVLHAQPNLVSQAIAAWPPLALFLAVEHIARVPVHRRWLAVARLVAAGVIAGIAAYVSYVHMVAVAVRFGETGVAPWLLPVSVDGLIIVASVCLVELASNQEPETREAESMTDTTVRSGQTIVDSAPDRGPGRLTVPGVGFTRTTAMPPRDRGGGTG